MARLGICASAEAGALKLCHGQALEDGGFEAVKDS